MNHNAPGHDEYNFMLQVFLFYFACKQPVAIRRKNQDLACLRTYCPTHIYLTAIFQLHLTYSL